jgi:hypothetical protein
VNTKEAKVPKFAEIVGDMPGSGFRKLGMKVTPGYYMSPLVVV